MQTESRFQASFLELFDTATSIVGYAKNKDTFTEYSEIIYNSLEEYDHLFDIYTDYPDINNLKTVNDNAGIEPVVVDQKIIDLLLYAKDMYELTDGKINIAFGAVLSLWHDHRTEGIDDPDNASIPDMEDLIERSQHTDINQVIIDVQASTVFLQDPDMRLDVGAIAKGYAVEQVCKIAEEAGFVNGMISVGGNVRAMGHKFDDNGKEIDWSVGIQNPDLVSEENTLHILNLTECSLVTSGIYERFFMVDGKSYHHIIDPETLMPAENFVAVSIVCQDSGMADGLSTAIFNMSFEDGLALIESLENVEAMWVFYDETQQFSSGFSELVKE